MTELITTIEASGEFDAVTMLRPGEPHFMLLGRDRLAPGLIMRWASYNRRRALREFDEGQIDKEKRDRELRKSRDAEFLAWTFQGYKKDDLAKKAAGEPTVKTYSGAEVPEETKLADRMQTLRLSAAAALNNAIAECAELVEFLRSTEVTAFHDEANILDETVGYMRASVEDVTPKRAVAERA
jgi:hypothetical protein